MLPVLPDEPVEPEVSVEPEEPVEPDEPELSVEPDEPVLGLVFGSTTTAAMIYTSNVSVVRVEGTPKGELAS